ncbi:MAG TPA: tetratricopeptide repeat protein [Caulobacteraceae bacterium]|nr:tetratricopeptide repeat protein [Caulobacteraceae bacterium]
MTLATPTKPPSPQLRSLLDRGVVALRSGDLATAEAALAQALRLDPGRYEVLHLCGMAAVRAKDWTRAVEVFRRAAKAAPASAGPHVNLCNALVETGRFAEAIEAVDRALAIDAGLADAWNSRGAALKGSGSLHAAADSFRRALALQPNNVQALCNLGALAGNLGAPDEALNALNRAAALAPGLAEAFSGRARLLLILDRPVEALADAERAIALRPGHAEAHANLGFALETLGRRQDAMAEYRQARTLDPDLPRKLVTRGLQLSAIDRAAEAVICFESALALDEALAEAHLRRGQVAIGRDPETAFREIGRAIELDPDIEDSYGLYLAGVMPCCEWDRLETATGRVEAAVRAGRATVIPFTLTTFSQSQADVKRCAEAWIARHYPTVRKPLAGSPYRHERLRVGYLSSDFFSHATAWLAAGVFERHDRARFETYAFSISGPRDEMQARLRGAFDHFIDCERLDEEAIAAAIREREIDILVDLKGFTAGARTGVLRHRPAPVQVQWLGYPGTMGAPYIDYIIGDAEVIPKGDERFFTEAVVRLPDSYQPNDPERPIGAAPNRTEAGLPNEAFVFCCFNASYKILPPLFDLWMSLLRDIEDSVLWLLDDNALASANLRRKAQARGIDPSRLIFAPRMAQAEHLARIGLADLVLDTLPYGAHTTASDALWAGAPVLTCRGQAFAGRVGASLLKAVGLPELITASLEDYHAQALSLARDRKRLSSLRDRLAANRMAAPLFDADRFTRHLEQALNAMHQRRRDNRAPAGFDVEPLP